ncbi:MAG: DUF763 domain-containing protein [Deferribacteres bacterium]|nr:DUF763 domain-containing protein [Deferribacteres bacterium]
MPRTGVATLPLHYGKAPRWLFSRMSMLAREILTALASEFSPEEILRRFSDPFWFQAFGCVLGFDWHSSGLTTTVLGAAKEGIRGLEGDIGIFIAGGKGSTSRKTPGEIESYGEKYSFEPRRLVYASKLSAKVDNTAVQDGYQLYHHVFLFTKNMHWAVVQQGMNPQNRMARRYHWLGDDVRDFVVEPHKAVCCDRRQASLNMVAARSEEARQVSVELARKGPDKLLREIRSINNLQLAKRHNITGADINPARIRGTLVRTYERQPEDFETLLAIQGVGPKTIRALSLVSELIYGNPPSYSDPARYSFAHGGKDGTPFPVDRKTYDRTIVVMKNAVQAARLGNEKLKAVRRLADFYHL